jgi:2-dehydropantoate 2-reductase
MRVGLIGAGAVGCWLGARLAEAGHDVRVLARGETLSAIRSYGLRLDESGRTLARPVNASDRAEDLGPQDLTILAVKAPALRIVAESARIMMGEDGVILPAMNGVLWWFMAGLGPSLADTRIGAVDPGGVLSGSMPPERVLGCVVHAAGFVREPGYAVRTMGDRLIVGEAVGPKSARLERIADVLQSAGLEVEISDRVQRDVWYKLWGNMTINPISALTGAMSDQILDDPLVVRMILSVMAEAAEIGRRIGCPIAQSGEDRLDVTRALKGFKTSMLQDAQAGRPLEIDALLTAPQEIAALVGVPTPALDALLGLTRLFARVNETTNKREGVVC